MGDYDCNLFWDTMNDQVVEQVLALFADEEIMVSSPPRTGLVMLTVKDSFDTDFHLGEVLVTDARVSCCGVEGFGMVMGEAPRKALARAAADAVFRSTGCVVKDRLTDIIVSEQKKRNRRLSESSALVAATKVNFDLM